VYPAQIKRRFCSRTCRKRDKDLGWVIGTCICGCGQPLLGEKKEAGKRKFADEEHYHRFSRECGLQETGCFRPLIERYIKEAQASYSPNSLVGAESSLVKLFRLAVEKGISDINEIRSPFITELINAEEARGTVHRNYVGFISTFFNCSIEDGLYDHANPVIPRRHYRKAHEHKPRPYTDTQSEAVWSFVEAGGQYELMLAFWIGAECGLRVGEVANIRRPDVDLTAQKIHVRLPTKNGSPRSVPFHDKVKKYLLLWLERRSQHCPTDHLLHNRFDRPFDSASLDARFHALLRRHDEPAASFSFHRLRHTWATRLLNNGMELAVLMELGGWKSLAGVACYIQILPTTLRRQYAAAYKAMQEQQDSGEDESLSLLDFAAMATEKPVTRLKPAA
jgi:integrase